MAGGGGEPQLCVHLPQGSFRQLPPAVSPLSIQKPCLTTFRTFLPLATFNVRFLAAVLSHLLSRHHYGRPTQVTIHHTLVHSCGGGKFALRSSSPPARPQPPTFKQLNPTTTSKPPAPGHPPFPFRALSATPAAATPPATTPAAAPQPPASRTPCWRAAPRRCAWGRRG